MRYERPSDHETSLGPAGQGEGQRLSCWPAAPTFWCACEQASSSPTWSSTSSASRRCARSQSAAGGFKIGAAVPGAELGEHAKLKKAWPGVVEAANLIGSKQVQGRCTMAGNLCNASPAADSVPALVAAGAKAVIVGPEGQAHHSGRAGAGGAGQDLAQEGRDHREPSCCPSARRDSGDAYLRFIPRTEMDIAVVGAGVSLTLDAKGVCTDARGVARAPSRRRSCWCRRRRRR